MNTNIEEGILRVDQKKDEFHFFQAEIEVRQ